MGDTAAIRARLGLDTTDWRANTQSAAADVARLTPELARARAAVRQMEQALRASGGGTAEAKKEFKEYQQALRQIEADHRRATRAVKEFTAAQAATAKAPESVRVTRGGGGMGIYSRSFTKPVRVSLPEKEDESHEEGGGGSNRLRNQELGHVARSIFDQVAAGQSPLRAIETEVPRILQAFGSSLGGVLKWLGPLGVSAGTAAAALGVAVTVLEHYHGEAVRLSDEVDHAGRPQASQGGDTYDAAIARARSKTPLIASAQAGVDSVVGNALSNVTQGVFDFARGPLRGIAGFINKFLPASMNAGIPLIPEAGTTREDALKQLQGQQAVEINRAAKDQSRDTAIDAKAFSQGEDAAAKDRLEQLFNKRRDEIERLVAENPALGDSDLLKSLREEIDLREKITKLTDENAEARRQDANSQIFISHPGMSGVDSQFSLPPNMAGVHSILSAQDNYEAAQSRLNNVRAVGKDTRAEEDDALRAKTAVEDAAVDRALMTPMEQNAADRAQLRRDQARERIDHPGTHDADRAGSSIHDASGPGGSMIPEAGSGTGALESPDNVNLRDNPSIPDNSFPAFPTMPAPEDINPALASNESSAAIDFSPVVNALDALGTRIVDATTGTA